MYYSVYMFKKLYSDYQFKQSYVFCFFFLKKLRGKQNFLCLLCLPYASIFHSVDPGYSLISFFQPEWTSFSISFVVERCSWHSVNFCLSGDFLTLLSDWRIFLLYKEFLVLQSFSYFKFGTSLLSGLHCFWWKVRC